MKKPISALLSALLSALTALSCIVSPVTAADIYKSLSETPSVSATTMKWDITATDAAPGSNVTLDVVVTDPVALSKVSGVSITVDSPITITGMSSHINSYNADINYTISGNTVSFSFNSSSPSVPAGGSTLFSVYFQVPGNCPEGAYKVDWISRDWYAETPSGSTYRPSLDYGAIRVKGGAASGTTTTTSTTSRTTTTTTTTTSRTTTTTTTTTSTTTSTTTAAYIENVSPSSVELEVGQTQQLSLTWSDPSLNYYNNGFNSNVEPSSGDTSVVTINSNGMISAVGAGSTYISLYCPNAKRTRYVQVAVKEKATTTTTTTTTTTATTTTTTSTTTAPVELVRMGGRVEIISQPYKTVYNVGDTLDLTGGVYKATGIMYLSNGDTSEGSKEVSMIESLGQFPVTYTGLPLGTSSGTPSIGASFNYGTDTSAVNMNKPGTYPISFVIADIRYPDYSGYEIYDSKTIYITVNAGTTSTTTTTTTSTTTTTTTTNPSQAELIVYTPEGELNIGTVVSIDAHSSDGSNLDYVWYQSSDNNVASVSWNGTVTLKNTGTAVVTVHASIGGKQIDKQIIFTVIDPNADIKLGDVNFNNKVDAVDASRVLSEYADLASGIPGSLSAKASIAADVNKDGSVNGKDASLILNYYAYLSSDPVDVITDMAEWLKTL